MWMVFRGLWGSLQRTKELLCCWACDGHQVSWAKRGSPKLVSAWML